MKARITIPGPSDGLKRTDRLLKSVLLKWNVLFRRRRPYKTVIDEEHSQIIWYFDSSQEWISKVYNRLCGAHMMTLAAIGLKKKNLSDKDNLSVRTPVVDFD